MRSPGLAGVSGDQCRVCDRAVTWLVDVSSAWSLLLYCIYPTLTKETRACTIVQELCESRGGRPGLSVLTSLFPSYRAFWFPWT